MCEIYCEEKEDRGYTHCCYSAIVEVKVKTGKGRL